MTTVATAVVTCQAGYMTRHVFVSGNPALDFVGTLKWRRSPEPEELLTTPADLHDWLDQSGLCSTVPRITGADLDRARDLREASYRLVAAACIGRPARGADLGLLNAAAAAPSLVPVADRHGLAVSGSARAVRSTLARAAFTAAFVDHEQLRECANPACTRIYLDRSHGARRTWCGMNECGGRAKVAAFRRRQHGA
jgi:predicted RNA-binding Zn ribbon-like protein